METDWSLAQRSCSMGRAAFLLPLLVTRASWAFTTSTVFTEGEGGIAGYRIPGLAFEKKSGALIAFAEGRVQTCNDSPGPHHLVCKTSTDAGETWSELKVIVDCEAAFPENTSRFAFKYCCMV